MVGAMAEGLVLEPYRSMTLPSLSTRNLVKFHSVRGRDGIQKVEERMGFSRSVDRSRRLTTGKTG